MLFVYQGHTHTHIHTPCLQDPTSEVAGQGHTHTHPAYKTRQARSPVKDTHTHTSEVAGQGHTHTPCLQDLTSWVAGQGDIHTLPTRPDKRGRRSGTYTYPAYKTQQVRSPVRDTHTHTPCLQDPTSEVAGQGHTHTPCLQDPTSEVTGQGHIHTLPTRPDN